LDEDEARLGMGDSGTLDSLIEDIYCAALDISDPPATFEHAARCLGYSAVAVVVTRSRYSEPECVSGWNVDIARWTRAEREFAILENLGRDLGRPMQAGEFAFRDELMPTERLREQPWFALGQDQPGIHDGLQFCVESSAERHVFLVFRQPIPWPEAPEDRALRRRLAARTAPHWVRANQIRFQTNALEMLRHAYAETANMLPFAMVVFDNAGRVLLSNGKAQRLITGDGLSLHPRQLQALDATEHQRLQESITKALEASLQKRPLSGLRYTTVSRPSGKRPYQITVKPLSPGLGHYARRPAAAAVIIDPDEEFPVTLERCQGVFGFTRAEAQVAVGIMQGRSVEQIATAQGNSITTVRNLLKRAFQKAGVTRQNELTRLLINSPLLFDLDSMPPP
jgi:DNA-binding CsgD family transcriptional regulator